MELASLAPEIVAKMKSLVDRGLHADQGKLMAVKDELRDLLLKHDLAEYRRVPPLRMGVHPANRDGQGISDKRAHALMAKIQSTGFSWTACADNAVAFETNPNANHIDACTVQLSNFLDGLAAYSPGQVVAGSVGAGHLNQGLAGFLGNVPCDIDEISVEGRMDRSTVEHDVNFKQALNEGLLFLVVRWQVEVAMPKMPQVFQSALNCAGQLHHPEDWLQMLCKVKSLHDEGETPGGICRIVSKSHSPCTRDVPAYIEYVRKWAAGKDAIFLEDLGRFCKLFVPANRHVSGQTFAWLAEMKCQPSELIPHFVNAIVMTEASGPKVVDGICKLFSKTDIQAATGAKKAVCREANTIMQEARRFLKSIPEMAQKVATTILGHLDKRLVLFALSKADTEFKSCVHIAQRFAHEVQAQGYGTEFPPWDPVGPSEASDLPTTLTSAPSYHEFDSSGSPINAGSVLVQSRGFVVGGHVRDKAMPLNELPFRITRIAPSGAVDLGRILENGELSDQAITVGQEEFLKRYTKTQATVELFEGWPGNHAASNPHMQDSVLKGVVVAASHMLLSSSEPPLRLRQKPGMAVFNLDTKPIAAGKLTLAPASFKIVTGSDVPKAFAKQNGIIVTIYMDNAKSIACMLPTISRECVAPFWAIRRTEDATESNCALTNSEVSVNLCANPGKRNATEKVYKVVFPCATNTCVLNSGDELVLLKQSIGDNDATTKSDTPAAPKRKAPRKS